MAIAIIGLCVIVVILTWRTEILKSRLNKLEADLEDGFNAVGYDLQSISDEIEDIQNEVQRNDKN